MAVLEKIRVKFGLAVSIIIALALLSFIIDPGTLETAMNSMSSKYDVGKIAGKSISYTDSDPSKARKMVSFIRAAAVREIANTVGFTSVSVVEEASYPTNPDRSPVAIGILGGIAAGFISFLVVVALTIREDTMTDNWRDREAQKRHEREKRAAEEES